ncbi:hypothetical protein Trydic_g6205 [Trypoxylus dichotomus]
MLAIDYGPSGASHLERVLTISLASMPVRPGIQTKVTLLLLLTVLTLFLQSATSLQKISPARTTCKRDTPASISIAKMSSWKTVANLSRLQVCSVKGLRQETPTPTSVYIWNYHYRDLYQPCLRSH